MIGGCTSAGSPNAGSATSSAFSPTASCRITFTWRSSAGPSRCRRSCSRCTASTARSSTFATQRVGHLFQGRYKAFLVEQDRYLEALIRYIHNNPVKAGLVDHAQAYRWSSDRFYRSANWPEWLDVERVLRRFAPTPARAAAAYRRWMGRNGVDDEAYQAAAPIGRVVKGDEKFAERSMRTARVPVRSHRRWTPGALAERAVNSRASRSSGCVSRSAAIPSHGRRIIVTYVGRRDYALSTTALAGCFGRETSPSFAHGLRRLEDAMERDQSLCRPRRTSRVRASFRRRQSCRSGPKSQRCRADPTSRRESKEP